MEALVGVALDEIALDDSAERIDNLSDGHGSLHPFPERRVGPEVAAEAGIAGGLVYWLFAGRRAGAWK